MGIQSGLPAMLAGVRHPSRSVNRGGPAEDLAARRLGRPQLRLATAGDDSCEYAIPLQSVASIRFLQVSLFGPERPSGVAAPHRSARKWRAMPGVAADSAAFPASGLLAVLSAQLSIPSYQQVLLLTLG